MQILIKQAIDSLRKEMGYEEWEEVDEEALLFQQGYDGDVIEVEDGETFEIPVGSEGQIINDNITYYVNVKIFEDVFEKEAIEGDLMAGIYRLEGHLIVLKDGND